MRKEIQDMIAADNELKSSCASSRSGTESCRETRATPNR